MPPSSVDLMRARITRVLNATAAKLHILDPNPASDHGTHITYKTTNGETFRITVERDDDSQH